MTEDKSGKDPVLTPAVAAKMSTTPLVGKGGTTLVAEAEEASGRVKLHADDGSNDKWEGQEVDVTVDVAAAKLFHEHLGKVLAFAEEKKLVSQEDGT